MDLLRSFLSMVVWNNSFEDSPSGGDDPSYGDDEITLLKEAIRERLEKEHKMNLADGTVGNDGWHKPGTAVVYFSASAPTTRPDGVTALTVDDNGRLWIRSSDYRVSVYDHGTGWVAMTTINGADNSFVGDNTFSGDNTFTGENTFDSASILSSTNVRIPTSEPASLADGDIWLS